jgi:hypothetical protein
MRLRAFSKEWEALLTMYASSFGLIITADFRFHAAASFLKEFTYCLTYSLKHCRSSQASREITVSDGFEKSKDADEDESLHKRKKSKKAARRTVESENNNVQLEAVLSEKHPSEMRLHKRKKSKKAANETSETGKSDEQSEVVVSSDPSGKKLHKHKSEKTFKKAAVEKAEAENNFAQMEDTSSEKPPEKKLHKHKSEKAVKNTAVVETLDPDENARDAQSKTPVPKSKTSPMVKKEKMKIISLKESQGNELQLEKHKQKFKLDTESLANAKKSTPSLGDPLEAPDVEFLFEERNPKYKKHFSGKNHKLAMETMAKKRKHEDNVGLDSDRKKSFQSSERMALLESNATGKHKQKVGSVTESSKESVNTKIESNEIESIAEPKDCGNVAVAHQDHSAIQEEESLSTKRKRVIESLNNAAGAKKFSRNGSDSKVSDNRTPSAVERNSMVKRPISTRKFKPIAKSSGDVAKTEKLQGDNLGAKVSDTVDLSAVEQIRMVKKPELKVMTADVLEEDSVPPFKKPRLVAVAKSLSVEKATDSKSLTSEKVVLNAAGAKIAVESENCREDSNQSIVKKRLLAGAYSESEENNSSSKKYRSVTGEKNPVVKKAKSSRSEKGSAAISTKNAVTVKSASSESAGTSAEVAVAKNAVSVKSVAKTTSTKSAVAKKATVKATGTKNAVSANAAAEAALSVLTEATNEDSAVVKKGRKVYACIYEGCHYKVGLFCS